jgi:hypothetical protein
VDVSQWEVSEHFAAWSALGGTINDAPPSANYSSARCQTFHRHSRSLFAALSTQSSLFAPSPDFCSRARDKKRFFFKAKYFWGLCFNSKKHRLIDIPAGPLSDGCMEMETSHVRDSIKQI